MILESSTSLGTNLFIAYIIYTILTYGKILFSKNKREKHKGARNRLAELRAKPNKTLEEQKEFINIKYPQKKGKFKWTFKNIMKIIGKMLLMVSVFLTARYLWSQYVGFDFAIWHIIIMMVILPIIINKILKKYNLHQDDILVFFK